jgi:hypothetical protein
VRALSVVSPKNQPFDLRFQGHTIHLTPGGTVQTGAAEDSRVYLALADFVTWTGVQPSTIEVAATGSPEEITANMNQLEQAIPAAEVGAFASARSAGQRVPFAGRQLTVRELTEDALEGYDLALFSAGAGTSRRFAREAVRRGCVVIDKSSAFRLADDVPLIVPEVNPETADGHRGIVANPNCSTIQLVHAQADPAAARILTSRSPPAGRFRHRRQGRRAAGEGGLLDGRAAPGWCTSPRSRSTPLPHCKRSVAPRPGDQNKSRDPQVLPTRGWHLGDVCPGARLA